MEILKLNTSSWGITLDNIHFVIDAHFSSTKQWDCLSDHEKKFHKASFFIVTQGDKKHFDIPSYKYVPQDRPLLIPSDLHYKAKKFLGNPTHVLTPGTPFIYETLKISGNPSGNTLFDWVLLKSTQCYYYLIEGKEGSVLVSGYIPNVTQINFNHDLKRPFVCLLPFGMKPSNKMLGGPLLNPAMVNNVFVQLKSDYLIPTADNMSQMMTLVRGSDNEKKILFVETGQKITI
ncbi:MAG: hypothetical protein ACD_73C00695G0001 [uncultured bacterium]|nr:MAG: hypothetical protein ACD_73C00695G0001 [uncultured bacterium]